MGHCARRQPHLELPHFGNITGVVGVIVERCPPFGPVEALVSGPFLCDREIEGKFLRNNAMQNSVELLDAHTPHSLKFGIRQDTIDASKLLDDTPRASVEGVRSKSRHDLAVFYPQESGCCDSEGGVGHDEAAAS